MSQPPAPDTATYALLQLGGWQLGVAATLVRQARAYVEPAALDTAAPQLAGRLVSGPQQLAALDLAHWLPQAQAASAAQGGYHVVLEHAGIQLAMRVDQLGGLRELPLSIVAAASPHSDMPLLRCITLDDDSTLHLLDGEELARQAGSAIAAASLQADSAALQDGEELRQLPPMGVFQLDGQRYALPAALIHEVISCPPMTTPFLWGGPLRGVTEWRGQHVYLLAPQQLGSSQSTAAMLAVVGDQHGYLGLPIDAALTLRRFRLDQLSGADDGQLYAGLIVDDQERPIRLLDSAALLRLIPHTSRSTRQQEGDSAQQRSREAYLVCRAGIRLAIPIRLVEQVCVLPADFSSAGATADGSSGSITWRDQTLPLHQLGAAPTRLLVICHGGRMLGLLVDAVETLLPALSASQPRAICVAGRAFRVISTRHASYTLFEPQQLDYFSTH
ncbi:chemotaxis protein CheW [Duganella fentianensis]|uniref:chemotaxis protein CheW n=1 Tax=Duganella fentianensis TaxID=2692177 RepID=UPI0032B12A6A